MMKVTAIAFALALAYSVPSLAADSMGKDQVKAEKERIENEYKAAKDKCNSLSRNAKDVCMAEAKGHEKVAKAELDAKQRDTPKARYDVAMAKADMEFDVAKQKCADQKGKEARDCRTQAKDAHDKAKADAKAERDSAERKKS